LPALRYPRFARYADLAQAAAIGIKTKMGVDELSCFNVNIMLALALVMALFCNGVHRAAINAFSAGSLRVKEAIGVVILVRSWRWFYRYFCYYRPAADCFSEGGN
jgi:ABC-type arginine transport system permease subunit